MIYLNSQHYLLFILYCQGSVSGINKTTTSYIPSDEFESHVIKRQTNVCNKNSFTCRDGNCVSSFNICDGTPDCLDESDETHSLCIKYQPCPKNTFHCAYGGCIDEDKICNGAKDCADSSDELLRSCPGFKWHKDDVSFKCGFKEFQCSNGECINSFLVCDGIQHCSDGSDETVTDCNDQNFNCPQSSFRCAYGACIDKSRECNGIPDCADKSDENIFMCNKTSSQTTATTEKISELTTPRPRPEPHSICSLPASLPGTTYKRKPSAPHVVEVTCDENYGLRITDRPLIVCDANEWKPQNQKCIPQCKGSKTISAEYICSYKGKEINCSYVNPGTVMVARCEHGYINEISPTYNLCLINGSWQDPLLRCYEDCGKLFNPGNVKPQITFGLSTSVSMFPWNVAIYHTQNGEWIHACGGSLISAYMVVTAAHCLRDKNENKLTKFQIKLAVGKYYRDWNRKESKSQIRDVAEMFVSKHYTGFATNYQFDIAVIELSTAVIFSAITMPVCVPDKNTNPRNGDLGKFQPSVVLHVVKLSQCMRNGTAHFQQVAGWGKDENYKNTEILKAANLHYIERRTCIGTMHINPNEVPEDKFCASSKDDNSSVMSGDSGAALVFESRGRYFIHGIVSTNIVLQQISTFTDINHKDNREFLQHYKRYISEKHSPQ
ncbi:modular serine protease-like isoform X2 [Lycorma delicatula]|uniref:modular serine protease-like isoform X2 n=1 Tax=Lycorma delicatula TaxID=130591 RepID=UPI003F517CF0